MPHIQQQQHSGNSLPRKTMVARVFKGQAVCLFALALAGCATMSVDECLTADWYQLGQQDAREGRQTGFLAQRSRDCREEGIAVDAESWHEGYQEGLRWFCTEEQGFRHGQSGKIYRNICPGEYEQLFLSGYDLGYGLYAVNQRIDRRNQRLEGLERAIQQTREAQRIDREQLQRLEEDRQDLIRMLHEDEVELAGLRGVAVGRGLAPVSR